MLTRCGKPRRGVQGLPLGPHGRQASQRAPSASPASSSGFVRSRNPRVVLSHIFPPAKHHAVPAALGHTERLLSRGHDTDAVWLPRIIRHCFYCCLDHDHRSPARSFPPRRVADTKCAAIFFFLGRTGLSCLARLQGESEI
jgi:hypothetical protein